jgi:predicted nucleic acid-binding protein
VSFLLDTCVLSELVKPKPSRSLVTWLERQSERSMYISVLTLAEIQGGIARLPRSKKRTKLELWLHDELSDHFEGRVLPVDTAVAMAWGRMIASARRRGMTVPVMDGLIAATATANDLMLISRNVDDFRATGVELLNPWG